jgi:hypothetical protein
MTTPVHTHVNQVAPARYAGRLAAQFRAVHTELARVDAKAGTLLAVAGVALSVGLSVLGRAHLPVAAAAAGWAAATAVGAAVALLAGAVRPQLGNDHGFVRLARLSREQLLDPIDPDPVDPAQLIWLARLTVGKYTRVRWSVDLLRVALAATGLAAVLAALG